MALFEDGSDRSSVSDLEIVSGAGDAVLSRESNIEGRSGCGMAADEGRDSAAESARQLWMLVPLETVGPLTFGMGIDDVAVALAGMSELDRFQADPHSAGVLGARFCADGTTSAVHTYFDEAGRLFCVAVDAAHGPQVTLDGLELAGRVPAELEQILIDMSWPEGISVSYGPRGNPSLNVLGLVVRVQEVASGVATRPVLVGREWADRCVDDWEGQVPECEWVGRQWPYPGFSDRWPPPGHAPNWGSWCPPF